MTLRMVKLGNKNDLVFKGICIHCGAEFEADIDNRITRLDQNCSYCNGIRTVNLYLKLKKDLILG